MTDIHKGPESPVPEIDYQTRLPGWVTDMIESGDHYDYEYAYENAPSPAIERMATDRELATDGASSAQITAAEDRLGVSLPPSYRAFLEASNGLFHASPEFNLLPVDEIRWFAQDHQDWVDAFADPREVDDEKYFTYGEKQDSYWFRPSYMQTALQISDVPSGDVALLIFDVRFGDEWEAWMFGLKVGAYRYRSFAEFFEREVLARSWH